MQSSGRIQVLKWLQNMIEQQRRPGDIKYEIESKIGKFVGKNPNAHRQVLALSNQFTQLNKNEIAYEFQSKVTLEQFKLAELHLKELKVHRLLRVDLNFSNKDQRASIVHDQRLAEQKGDEPNTYKGSGNLTEKRRQLMNHIDIINEQLNYRISLSSEKELSASLKDIFQQINSRQDKIALIRIKETLLYEDDLFEQSLSTVYSVFKNNTTTFKGIINVILENKYYAKDCIDKVFSQVALDKIQPTYEIEVELKSLGIQPDKEQTIAELLLEKTEELCEAVNKPLLLRRTGSQEFNDEPIKKVKTQ